MATKAKKIPRSAAEKEARANLVMAERLALEANSARAVDTARGAISARPLRSSGSSLDKYIVGGFQDDPGLYGGRSGGFGGTRGLDDKYAPRKPTAPRVTTRTSAKKPRRKTTPPPKVTGRTIIRGRPIAE